MHTTRPKRLNRGSVGGMDIATFDNRNTLQSINQDISRLEEISALLEYGDTGTALQMIEDWNHSLSDISIDLEERLKLFDKDPIRYFFSEINRVLTQISSDYTHPL